MVYDSLLVSFGISDQKIIGPNIVKVIDNRSENEHFIGVHEANKYLYIPVDRYIALKRSLSTEIFSLFDSSGFEDYPKFWLQVDEFKLSRRKQFFMQKFVTHAIIDVLEEVEEDSLREVGSLVYDEYASAKKFMATDSDGYAETLEQWKSRLKNDLIKLSIYETNHEHSSIPNLYPIHLSKKKRIVFTLNPALSPNVLLVDGEILFTRAEPSKVFYSKAYNLRYRKEEKFQSFQFSLANDQMNWRLGNHFVTTLKSGLYLGINQWAEEEYQDKLFWDIFIIDYSLSQFVSLHPKNRSGIVCGLGVMGSVSYIFSQGFQFQPFLAFQMGIKI